MKAFKSGASASMPAPLVSGRDNSAADSAMSPTSSNGSERIQRSFSDDFYFTSHNRKASSGSNKSSSSSSSSGLGSSSSSTWPPSRRSSGNGNVNVYTTCGRHSNQWLFSGWSLPFVGNSSKKDSSKRC